MGKEKKKRADERAEDSKEDISAEAAAKYPSLVRMINSLDKFLSRRIASVVLIYMCAMAVLGAVAITNGVRSNASSGAVLGTAPEIWLYSIIATLTLLFVLVIIRVIYVKTSAKKKETNSFDKKM